MAGPFDSSGSLGVGVSNFVTVGKGGMFSDLPSALNWRAGISHTLLTTFTGSSATGENMEGRDLTADTGTPLTNYSGRRLVAQIGGAGPYMHADVVSNSKIRLLYPISSTVTSLSISLYTPAYAGIFILPGTEIDISSGNVTIPGFTTVYSIPNTSRIVDQSLAQGVSIVLASDNEIRLFGLSCWQYNKDPSGTAQLITLPSSGSYMEQCDWSIDYCDLRGSYFDTIFSSASILSGGLRVSNCKISGYYDTIRLYTMRLAEIYNNEITVMGSTGAGASEVAALALGGGVPSTYPHQNIIVQNNKIEAFYDRVSGTYDSDPVSAMEIRGSIPSNMKISMQGNFIRARANYATGTSRTAAIIVTQTTDTTNTPSIYAMNNTIDSSTAGTGATYSFHSGVANYVIKHAGNNILAGTLGSNTATITTV